MRVSQLNEIRSLLSFTDHWDEERAVAFEMLVSHNLTVFYKPCSVIPLEEPLGHPILEDQLAPIIATRLDTYVVRPFMADQRVWINAFLEHGQDCYEEKEFKGSMLPRAPGCLLYWTPELAKWNMNNYGASLESILSLLRCRNVSLDVL
jgi:hypothetical protein